MAVIACKIWFRRNTVIHGGTFSHPNQAPPPGYYKANWDAAVDIKRGRRGFGAIIRDSGGHEVAARSTTQNSIVDPIVVEAWAGMVAANLCKDVGVFLILFSNQIPSKL